MKKKEEMSDRDWRIFREDQDIGTKGGRIPVPIREWEDMMALGVEQVIMDNVNDCGYLTPMPI